MTEEELGQIDTAAGRFQLVEQTPWPGEVYVVLTNGANDDSVQNTGDYGSSGRAMKKQPRGGMAEKVADYILWFAHQKGDLITNLKLQKLLYYAQAWHLALYETSLFDDDFEAWVYGPVHRRLYQRFKAYRWNPISYDPPEEPDLPPTVKQHIVEIMEVFGDYSAFTLERMVHSDTPWIKARAGLPPDAPSRAIISKDDMKEFYAELADA